MGPVGKVLPGWSIVLPVHNQADHLARVVQSYLEVLPTDGSSQVLLVPNGCTDDSVVVCQRLADGSSAVAVVSCERSGWGAAVRTGLAAASGDRLCFTNLARTSARDLQAVLFLAQANPDAAVKAVRTGRERWLRRAGSAAYNAQARLTFGVRSRDVNATPKAFPRGFSPLLHLTRDDDLLDLEFVVSCQENGFALLEVPIRDTRRHGGRSTTGWRTAMRLYTGALGMRVRAGKQ